MKKSSLKLAETEAAEFVSARPVQQELTRNIIAYPCTAGVGVIDAKQRLERIRKRRRRLALFVTMETIALLLLAVALTGATSELVRQAGLLRIFRFALIPAGFVVAIIPVFFFGMTREEYRYRARRYRAQ